jgi:hypothetical protein
MKIYERKACANQGFEDVHAVINQLLDGQVREHVQRRDEPVGSPAADPLLGRVHVVDPDALGAEVAKNRVPFDEVERVARDEDQPHPLLEAEIAGVPDAESRLGDSVRVHAGDARRQALDKILFGADGLQRKCKGRRPGFPIQARDAHVAAVHEFRHGQSGQRLVGREVTHVQLRMIVEIF